MSFESTDKVLNGNNANKGKYEYRYTAEILRKICICLRRFTQYLEKTVNANINLQRFPELLDVLANSQR